MIVTDYRMNLKKARMNNTMDEKMLDEIDKKAIERLKRKIVLAESTNLRTKNKTDAQMVKDIMKWIEEEVKCCSNQ